MKTAARLELAVHRSKKVRLHGRIPNPLWMLMTV